MVSIIQFFTPKTFNIRAFYFNQVLNNLTPVGLDRIKTTHVTVYRFEKSTDGDEEPKTPPMNKMKFSFLLRKPFKIKKIFKQRVAGSL